METIDVLIGGRAAVEKAWTKHVLYNPVTGGVCALGGCFVGAGVDLAEEKMPQYQSDRHPRNRDAVRASTVLYRHLPPAYNVGLPFYNDAQNTTKADVLALYDRAIASIAIQTTADPAHTYTVA